MIDLIKELIKQNPEYTAIAISIVIIGLVQIVKMYLKKKKYYAPIAVFIGIAFGVIYFGNNIKTGILVGLIMGLNAVGLYSGTKNTIAKDKG